jgi:hypothetical protein
MLSDIKRPSGRRQRAIPYARREPVKRSPLILPRGDDLLCPCCGGEYLHVGSIIEYRPARGVERFRKVTIDGAVRKSVVGAKGSHAPDMRWGGLVIQTWCEDCGAEPELLLTEHAGNSRLSWRF